MILESHARILHIASADADATEPESSTQHGCIVDTSICDLYLPSFFLIS